jgi:hypothetical protein
MGDTETMYTENRQWQMISAEGESGTWEQIRERTLLLQRQAQVFDAHSTPTFKLVETEMPASLSGTLSTSVAVNEILHAVISDDDVKNAVAAQIDDNGHKQEVADAIDESVSNDLKDTMIDTIAQKVSDDGSATQAAADVVTQASTTIADSVIGADAAPADTTPAHPTDETPATGTASVLTVQLAGPDGTIIDNPAFHFKKGSVLLVIDPIDHFHPGVYTLTVLVTNPVTGEVTTMQQQFGWGVLAMNPDKDVYHVDDRAEVDFGVLDDHGEVVCKADLQLAVVAPDGSTQTYSTDDQTIETTGTCGTLKAGFIEPDFRISLPLTEEGNYDLTLTATTDKGTRQLSSTITVQSDALYTIERKAATRLWPFAPSPMDVTVHFATPITGTITDTVPEGFTVDHITEGGRAETLDDGTTVIRWHGSWSAGETVHLHYMYDAPDISPQFYLVGPLRIFSDSPLTEQ